MSSLSAQDIIRIHDKVVALTGGSLGLREPGLLMAITDKPKASFDGEDLYPALHDKAAALFEALCNYHVFVDGNKRTAITCIEYYLFLNSLLATASQDEKEHFTLQVAGSHPDLAEVAAWIKKNTKPVRN